MANFLNTVGALEIGTSFSLVLFGIVTMQTYIYWRRFEEDRHAFKILVAVVWLLELGHTIAVSRELYRAMLLVAGAIPAHAYPSFGVVTILSGFITTTVQLFFSYRVYTALPSPYRFIGALTALAALARCVTCIYIGSEVVAGRLDVAQSQRYARVITILLASSAAIDVIIATAMLGFLGRKRERSLKLMKLIDHMMLITLRTGLMTSIGAVAVLILYVTMPRNYIHLSVFVCLAKLYSNSLLSALNARNALRDTAARPEYTPAFSPQCTRSGGIVARRRAALDSLDSLGSLRKDSAGSGARTPTIRSPPPIYVQMRTTTEARGDGDSDGDASTASMC